jgi:hypothetical protein
MVGRYQVPAKIGLPKKSATITGKSQHATLHSPVGGEFVIVQFPNSPNSRSKKSRPSARTFRVLGGVGNPEPKVHPQANFVNFPPLSTF